MTSRVGVIRSALIPLPRAIITRQIRVAAASVKMSAHKPSSRSAAMSRKGNQLSPHRAALASKAKTASDSRKGGRAVTCSGATYAAAKIDQQSRHIGQASV